MQKVAGSIFCILKLLKYFYAVCMFRWIANAKPIIGEPVAGRERFKLTPDPGEARPPSPGKRVLAEEHDERAFVFVHARVNALVEDLFDLRILVCAVVNGNRW